MNSDGKMESPDMTSWKADLVASLGRAVGGYLQQHREIEKGVELYFLPPLKQEIAAQIRRLALLHPGVQAVSTRCKTGVVSVLGR